jgi:Ca-activated chloride channel family protein
MEKLADKAMKLFVCRFFGRGPQSPVSQLGATLFTIASDVKVQGGVQPACVSGYRPIGYERPRAGDEDFNDDQKGRGRNGAGLAVTAPLRSRSGQPLPDRVSVDPLRYQETGTGDHTCGPIADCEAPLQDA